CAPARGYGPQERVGPAGDDRAARGSVRGRRRRRRSTPGGRSCRPGPEAEGSGEALGRAGRADAGADLSAARGADAPAPPVLDGAQVRASFEQVRCERVPQEVRVDAFGLEPGLRGQAAEDEEDSGASEWSAACIEEELLSVPPLEERPATSKVEAEGLRRLASDRNDAFLIPLAEAPDEPVLEVDRIP